MSGPITKAGRLTMAFYDSLPIERYGKARRELLDAMREHIVATEQEARHNTLTELRAAWDDAKRRKGSVMHDVGDMSREVDNLLYGE